MRRFLAPKWLALHVLVAAAVLVMLRLGLWQWHRAESASGGIQNYAYAFQWPLFAGFAIVLWIRTMYEDLQTRPADGADGRPPQQRVDADIVRRGGVVIGVTAPTASAAEIEDDPEVAEWNARLAALNAAHTAAESRRR
jgi:DNA-binding transcriptional regulator of glucitol operon